MGPSKICTALSQDYYVALVRALLTLEGMALAADCNFDIFEAAGVQGDVHTCMYVLMCVYKYMYIHVCTYLYVNIST